MDYQVEHVNVGMEWGDRKLRAVKLRFPSNRVDVFVTDDYRGFSATSEYRNAEGEVLSYYPETRLYRYEMAGGRVLVIHASNGLRSMNEPNGSSWTVEGNIRRQEITDERGRSMVYERAWKSGGYRVVAITTPEGHVFRYQYDSLGNLTTVIYPDDTTNDSSDNPRRQYLFEDPDNPRNITGIIDEDGERHATYAYDSEGRAVLSEHAGGAGRVALRYLGDHQTEVTYQVDAERDTTLLYEHDLFDGRGRVTRIERRACENCAPEDALFSYDANGHLAKKVDYSGVASLYTHDERGLELRRVEAFETVDERSSAIEWHPEFRRPTAIHDTAQSRHLSYDSAGNRSEIRVVDRATGASQVTGYSHNSYGQVTDIDGPRTDVPDRTRFEYDGQGNRVRVINALYQTTEITNHDAAGRPVRLVDPNGVVTELDYDARGRLIRQQTGGAVASFERDRVGQLTRLTLPDGTHLSYEYDAAHRLTAIEATDGERVEFQHDAMGNVTTERIHDVGGQLVKRHTQVFDELGRLLEQTSADGGVRRYGYDVNSNRVSTLDERSNETQRAYDALDRVSEVIDPALGETHYTYNSRDQISSVTDPEGLTTHYRYDGLGNLVEVTSPDTGLTTFEYDSAGNRISRQDARGVRTEYDYDALNRLTAVRYPDFPGENVSYHYDSEDPGRNGIGRLTRVEDPSGTTRYFYDHLGNVTRKETELNGHALTVEYQYDRAGQLTGVTYPSGQQLSLTRDTQGRVSALHTRLNGQSSDQVLADSIDYLPFGPLSQVTYGNGLQEVRTHDLDYRLTGIELGDSDPLRRRLYEYDAVNNITRIEDPTNTGNAVDYAYDPINRLVEAINSDYDLQFSYDPVGNRTDKTTDGVAENYQYATDSHHLLLKGTQNYQYDAVGNTINNGTYQFEYSAANRMVQASQSGTTVADYTHNALGQRVIKALPDGTVIHYLYNEQGQLIGEYDSAGNAIREYVYLEGAPLSMVSGNRVYYYHNDHLGTPQLLTDAQQTVVWKAVYTPFGKASVEVAQVTNKIRFPGQYFDSETGLHYNYFRDYDPTTGRYLQSDPIGLRGGLNTYAYVSGNPLKYVDPLGLVWVTTGVDHHGVKNWAIGIVDRLSNLDEGTVMNAYNFEGATRDVTQTWVDHPNDPQNQRDYCMPDDPMEGDTRTIEQTFGDHPDPWAVEGNSWHWAPPVPSPTWDVLP
ncbi:RHS repeat-associated core domain-containing protein [Marinimicrobium locisalis]|uniref:RHS repeat-associated core domain-containing protein n=1 Tax=Marinimicrobium locisalis TaxID=546022 RepID=UPI003221E150